MKDIVIIGAGGFGRETAELIEDINTVVPEWNLLGFLDDNKEIHGKYINSHQVLGDISLLNSIKNPLYTVCAIANCQVKKNILEQISNSNIIFANLIHPTSVVSKTVEIGHGVIIQSNSVITSNVVIANHVGISPQCGIGHDSCIEEYSTLFWNVNIGGYVRIGKGTLLGTKTTIIQERRVGEWSIIGSNSNVIRDIPGNCTAVGNPARVIKFNS